jgi:hypothetical protein
MLMVTIDTLPRPFQILGLVHASTRVPADVLHMTHLLDMLEDQAASMGADGVIGIRLSQATVPGSSRDRVLGRVTDHYGSMVMATALGTAVRLLPSPDAPDSEPSEHRPD